MMDNQEPTGTVTNTDQASVDNQKPKGAESPGAKVPFWHQLRWTLILNFILLAVLPVAVVLAIVMTRTSEQATQQVINQLESVAQLKRDQLTQWIEDSQLVLEVFLSNPTQADRFKAFTVSTLPPSSGEAGDDTWSESMLQEQAALNSLLRDMVKAQDFFEEVFLYNTDGEIVAASNEVQLGKIVTRQPYFAGSLVGEFVQTPYYEIGKGELTMVVTQPLVDSQNDRTVGVLAGRLDTSTMGQIMLERAGLEESGETYLVSPESNYMLTPSRFEGYPLQYAYHTTGIDEALAGQSGAGTYENYRAKRVIGVYRWLPELKVALLAEIEQAEALIPFAQARNFILIVAVGASLLAVGIGLYTATRISGPVSLLTQVATRIAQGNLGQRAEIGQRNEIGLLATAFNQMTDQLRRSIDTLEDEVVARTFRLEVMAALGEYLSGILELDQLLAAVVNQVQQNFNYYHAHIYLLDQARENLVVAEGTGKAGAAMKAGGHSIPLNAPTSLVARAARSADVVRVDNVREAEDWLPNPLLPDTYAEMAVPIISEGQVVGVLDVQQDEIGGLDESDATLLRSLTNYVAVTIRNAHLFADAQTKLAEAREVQRQYVEQAWDRTRVARRGTSRVQFSLGESTTLSEATMAQARQQAMSQKEPAVVVIDEAGPESSGAEDQDRGDGKPTRTTHHAFVAPVTLHETAIGDLQLHDVDPDRKWTKGELALIETVLDQVAQAAENLRLLDETQERASREQLISHVSDKLRRAPDMETLVKTTVTELARVLGPARTFVRLGSEEQLGAAGPGVEADNGQSASEADVPVPVEDGPVPSEPESSLPPPGGRGGIQAEESKNGSDD